MNDNLIIQAAWTGPELTPIQKLCIRSFQDHGHEFHLYVYEDVKDIPDGTIVHNGKEILDYSHRSRFSGENYFSDYFRVMMILKKGGWYVDLDEICLRPFDFNTEYVFVSEFWDQDPSKTVESGCIFKAPVGCPFLEWVIQEIDKTDTMHPTSWIALGPEMFRRAIKLFNFKEFVQPPNAFDPLYYNQLQDFVRGGKDWGLAFDKSYTIHLRTSFWNGPASGLYPGGKYHPSSLFEWLKRKHGVE